MKSFDFTIFFWAISGVSSVNDFLGVAIVFNYFSDEFFSVVGSDFFNGEWEFLLNIFQKLDGIFFVGVTKYFGMNNSGCVIDCCVNSNSWIVAKGVGCIDLDFFSWLLMGKKFHFLPLLGVKPVVIVANIVSFKDSINGRAMNLDVILNPKCVAECFNSIEIVSLGGLDD